jgi:hypothetical protein
MRHATPLHNRRDLENSLEIINRHGLPGNGKSPVGHTLQQAVITTVQGAVEHSVEAELTPYRG